MSRKLTQVIQVGIHNKWILCPLPSKKFQIKSTGSLLKRKKIYCQQDGPSGRLGIILGILESHVAVHRQILAHALPLFSCLHKSRRQQIIAQLFWFLLPRWKTQIECQTSSLGMTNPYNLQAFMEWVNRGELSLAFSPLPVIYL